MAAGRLWPQQPAKRRRKSGAPMLRFGDRAQSQQGDEADKPDDAGKVAVVRAGQAAGDGCVDEEAGADEGGEQHELARQAFAARQQGPGNEAERDAEKAVVERSELLQGKLAFALD